MKILYLSCHSILEADEVKMLHEIGHEVFSPGAYVEPKNPGDPTMRPALNFDYSQEIKDAWHHMVASKVPGKDGKDHLTKEFVDLFDAVIVMHIPRWISNNWDVIKHKKVIWRTIGQSIAHQEAFISRFRREGLYIVRYSPAEERIPNYVGADIIIRFYKDPSEFCGWTGHEKKVITFGQSMHKRGNACNFSLFEQATRDFPRELYGPETEEVSFGLGKVPFHRLKEVMRESRVYFYTGTHPASYTLNFIEAWMTGCPMVCIGPGHGNPIQTMPGHLLYEVDSLISHGETGFVSDNREELSLFIRQLLNDGTLADRISAAARRNAIHYFGKEKIYSQWTAFLEALS